MSRDITETSMRRATLNHLDSIQSDVKKLDKKVEKISGHQDALTIKFERLDSKLDVMLPDFLTESKANKLIVAHDKDCLKKSSTPKIPSWKPRAPASIQFNITPQAIAKITAVLGGLGGAIWGILEYFIK